MKERSRQRSCKLQREPQSKRKPEKEQWRDAEPVSEACRDGGSSRGEEERERLRY